MDHALGKIEICCAVWPLKIGNPTLTVQRMGPLLTLGAYKNGAGIVNCEAVT